MDYSVGQIVKAKAGRDKDCFFVIIELDNGFAMIADGKTRKVERPKRKKLIHLAPTNTVVQGFATNREVKHSLAAFLHEDDN